MGMADLHGYVGMGTMQVWVGKSTGKPVGLKCATRTHTHGIPLTHSAKVGYKVGTGLRVWVAMQESTKVTRGCTHAWVHMILMECRYLTS